MERLQAFSGIKCNMRSCCLVAGSHVFSSFLMFLAMVTSSCCLQKRNIAGNGESVQSDSRSLDIWQHCSRTDLDKLPGLLLIACVSGHGWSKLITFGHRLSRMCFWPLSHFAAIVLAFFCYLHMFLAILTFHLNSPSRTGLSQVGQGLFQTILLVQPWRPWTRLAN